MAELVSIITTTYRSHDKLKNCLSSVMQHTKFVDYKHYVWCNDPDQNTKQIINDAIYLDGHIYNDRIEPVFNDSNDGSFSSNNNEMAQEVEGKYLLFLNDDAFPIPENESWLYSMTQIMENDDRIGVVGSLLLYPDKKTIQHCGVFFSSKTNNMPFHMFYRQPIDSVKSFVLQPRYYQAITGACMLVKKEDFISLGGFSNDFYYQFEDIELCIRIKNELRKSCVYCPDSVLVHDEGISKDGRNNPKWENNINTFKNKCSGKFMNDLEFYLSSPNHMVYKKRAG